MSFDSLLNTTVTLYQPVLSIGALREQVSTQSLAYSAVPARISQARGQAQFTGDRRESRATHTLFCRFPDTVAATTTDLAGGIAVDASTGFNFQILKVGDAAGHGHHVEADLFWNPEGKYGA